MDWDIPKIWEGGDCWIVGGGPSMPRQFDVPEEVIQSVRSGKLPPSTYSQYMTFLHDKHVIGCNSSFKIGNWIDILAFGDKKWYEDNRIELLKFPKIIVGYNNAGDVEDYKFDGIKTVRRDHDKPKGISTKKSKVSWNKNTGFASINLAYHLGVKRVFLLGFDMKLDESNKQHWHGLYKTYYRTNFNPQALPFGKHLSYVPAIKQDADRLGLEIINLCPESAIKHFRKANLKDFL